MKTNRRPSAAGWLLGMGVIGCISLLTPATAQTTYYVATNGNGTAGTSWDTAYTNLHDALAVVSAGDTLYLAGQTFAITQQLAWTTGDLSLLGGYAATNNADMPGPRDPDRWPTVITRNPDFGAMRLLYLHTVSDVTLDGIGFQGGSHAASYGGGLYLESVTGLRLINGRIHDNYVGAPWGGHSYGGGLYAKTVSGLISNVVFSANWVQGSGAHRSGNGGGAYIEGGSLTLRDTVFQGNTSHGGGSAHGYGGGIYFYSGSHTVRNALLVHNRGVYGGNYITPSSGGGIYVRSGVTLLVDNATIYGNTSDGIYNLSAGTTVRNSIVYQNLPDIGGTVTPTLSNNLTGTDPLFDDDWFYLSEDSPAINAGDRSVADAGLTGYTTRTDGTPDSADVDLGYHYALGLAPYEEWYVSRDNGNDAGDGASQMTAFQSLTHALNQAGERAIIHVAAGTYATDTETFPLRIRDRTVQIQGTNAALTVINAAGAVRAFDLADVWGNNRLEGVTVRGGSGDYQGGGLLVLRSRLSLDHCYITHNSGSGHTDVRWGGAGLHARQVALAISRCEFRNNSQGGGWGSWGQGGGLYAADVTGFVRDSLFADNVAQGGGSGRPGYGGAVYLLRAVLAVENSRFIRNRASYGGSSSAYGGAFYMQQGAPVLRNLLIADNTVSPAGSTVFGGGLYVQTTGQPVIENCTIVTNRNGGGLYGFDANLTVVNTILWTNTPMDFTNLTAAAFSYSRADGLTPDVQGNITGDPLFIDPAADDYRLQSRYGQYDDDGGLIYHAVSSPCLDAGTNRAWMAAATDLRGVPRIVRGIPRAPGTPRVDMGAYETHTPPTGTLFLFK